MPSLSSQSNTSNIFFSTFFLDPHHFVESDSERVRKKFQEELAKKKKVSKKKK